MQLQLALELQDGSPTIPNQPTHPKHLTASNTLPRLRSIFRYALTRTWMMMIVDMQVVWNVCLDSEKELEGMDENDEWSDTESLAELEGDELEASLQALRPKYKSHRRISEGVASAFD
jgi:hypothetical protein